MTIGTPVNIGTASNSATSGSLTTTATAPAGSLIFLAFASLSLTDLVSAVGDANGNTYTAGAVYTTAGGYYHQAFWTITTSALTAGAGAITWTQVSTTTVGLAACYVTGVATVSPLDQESGTGGASSASPSASTGTLASANEIVFGYEVHAGAGVTTTEGAGFTTLKAFGGSNQYNLAYQNVSATTAVTYNPTLSAAAQYGVAVYAFAAPSTGTNVSPMGAASVASAAAVVGSVAPATPSPAAATGVARAEVPSIGVAPAQAAAIGVTNGSLIAGLVVAPATSIAVANPASPVNLLPNPTMSGAVVGVIGSGGQLPTGFTSSANGSHGINGQVIAVGVTAGLPSFTFRLYGTNSLGSTLYCDLYPQSSTYLTALPGQTYVAGLSMQLVAGSMVGFASAIDGRVASGGYTSIGGFLEATTSSTNISGALTPTTATHLMAGATVARANPYVSLSIPNGNAIDATILFAGWTFAQPSVTPSIGALTYQAAAIGVAGLLQGQVAPIGVEAAGVAGAVAATASVGIPQAEAAAVAQAVAALPTVQPVPSPASATGVARAEVETISFAVAEAAAIGTAGLGVGNAGAIALAASAVAVAALASIAVNDNVSAATATGVAGLVVVPTIGVTQAEAASIARDVSAIPSVQIAPAQGAATGVGRAVIETVGPSPAGATASGVAGLAAANDTITAPNASATAVGRAGMAAANDNAPGAASVGVARNVTLRIVQPPDMRFSRQVAGSGSGRTVIGRGPAETINGRAAGVAINGSA